MTLSSISLKGSSGVKSFITHFKETIYDKSISSSHFAQDTGWNNECSESSRNRRAVEEIPLPMDRDPQAWTGMEKIMVSNDGSIGVCGAAAMV